MTKKKVASRTRVATLRVNIKKTWLADDFATTFDALNKVYLFNEALEEAYLKITEGDFPADRGDKQVQLERLLKQLSRQLISECYGIFGHTNERYSGHIVHLGVHISSVLMVKRINFNSPGSIDFAGFGKALEVIRDWFNRYNPNEGERLDNELKRKEIEAKNLDLAQKKIDMMKELGVPIADITALVGLEALQLNRLEHLRKSEQITGMELVDN